MNVKYVPFISLVILFDCEELSLALDTLQVVADCTENEEASNILQEIIDRIRANEPDGMMN